MSTIDEARIDVELKREEVEEKVAEAREEAQLKHALQVTEDRDAVAEAVAEEAAAALMTAEIAAAQEERKAEHAATAAADRAAYAEAVAEEAAAAGAMAADLSDK